MGTSKALRSQLERQLTERNWQTTGVDVKLVPGPAGTATFLLARSADHQAKEHAMHEKFAARLKAGLVQMKTSIESGRLKELIRAQRRAGRLLEQNWRVAQPFEITIEPLAEPVGKA